MGFDPELEDILNSIKNKEGEAKAQITPIDLPAPKPKLTATEESEPEENAVPDEPTAVVPTEFAPPEKKAEPKPKPEKPKKERIKSPQKPKKEKKPVKLGVKLTAIGIAAAAVIVTVIAFASSQNLYIGKFEKKYGVPFPQGIPQELCDYYGKNQSLAGGLTFEGDEKEIPVYSKPADGEALFERGSDINADQHYRAIAISKNDADLEAMYKEAESYTSSSQSFTFSTVNGERDKYHVIAAYIVNTKPEDDNGYAFPYNCYGNFTEKSYKHYQDTIKCRSLYDTGYRITPEDYCLSISVPTDIMPDFRFVIVGVKVKRVKRITEVKENARIRYPQVYCDKLGIHNIYNFAYDWYPEIIVNSETGETKQLTAENFK